MKKNQSFRTEVDSLGEIKVPKKALWGAQTQRSLKNFKIGNEKIPKELIRALGIIKLCAAKTYMNFARNAIFFLVDME